MISIEDYIDVRKRAQALECQVPTSIAILPRNYETAKSKEDLVHESTSSTIRVLWRQNNIHETPLEKEDESIPFIVEESFAWIGPIIFIASAIITQNPHLVNLALNILSNYLTDWFRGIRKQDQKVSLKIVIETKSGTFKKINFDGPTEGLKELPKIIRSTYDEQ